MLPHEVTPFASDVVGGAPSPVSGSEAVGALTSFLLNGVMGRPCTTGDCAEWRSIPREFFAATGRLATEAPLALLDSGTRGSGPDAWSYMFPWRFNHARSHLWSQHHAGHGHQVSDAAPARAGSARGGLSKCPLRVPIGSMSPSPGEGTVDGSPMLYKVLNLQAILDREDPTEVV
jgi:hypothetical protein